MSKVFLIRVPGEPALADLQKVRDFILASLPTGVLAVGSKWDYVFLDLGEVRGVTVAAAEPDQSPAGESGEDAPAVTFSGKGSADKRRIHARLTAYRKANGLGSFEPLAKILGCGTEVLRAVYIGETAVDLAAWYRIDKALDEVERC